MFAEKIKSTISTLAANSSLPSDDKEASFEETRVLVSQVVERNRLRSTTRDPYVEIEAHIFAENRGLFRVNDEASFCLWPRSCPLQQPKLEPFRALSGMGVGVAGKDYGLFLNPRIKRQNCANLHCILPLSSSGYKNAEADPDSVLAQTIKLSSDPESDDFLARVFKYAYAEPIEKDQNANHANPIALMLAALAVEHALIPITTEIVPIDASLCVIDLSCQSRCKIRNAISNEALLWKIASGYQPRILTKSIYDSREGDDVELYHCVYVPFGSFDRAMSLFSALGRHDGPYRHHVKSCWMMDKTESKSRVIIVSPIGTGGDPLKNIKSEDIWQAISDCLYILETFNGLEHGVFEKYFLMILGNTPVYDMYQSADLGATDALWNHIPHRRTFSWPERANEWDQELEYGNHDSAAAGAKIFASRHPNTSGCMPSDAHASLCLAAYDRAAMRPRPFGDFWVVSSDLFVPDIRFWSHLNDDENKVIVATAPNSHTFMSNFKAYAYSDPPSNSVQLSCSHSLATKVDPWFPSGNARLILLGFIYCIDLPQVTEGVTNPGLPEDYAACGMTSYASQQDFIAALSADNIHLPQHFNLPMQADDLGSGFLVRVFDPALVPPGARERINVLCVRNLHESDDFVRPVPLPGGISIAPKLDAIPYTTVLDSYSRQWTSSYDACNLIMFGDSKVQNHFWNNPDIDDSELDSFLRGHSFSYIENHVFRVLKFIHDFSCLNFRAHYDTWKSQDQKMYEETISVLEAPYSYAGPEQHLYLGGLATPIYVDCYTGIWPLFRLRRPVELKLMPPIHSTIRQLSDKSLMANLVLAMRSAADLTASLIKLSNCSTSSGAYWKYFPDAIIYDPDIDQQFLCDPSFAQPFWCRVLASLCNIEVANLAIDMAKSAKSELTPGELKPATAHSNIEHYFYGRVPQVLPTSCNIAYLDVAFPDFSPSKQFLSIINRCNFRYGLLYESFKHAKNFVPIDFDMLTDIWFTILKATNGIVTKFVAKDFHGLNVPVTFVDKSYEHDLRKPYTRYNPGYRLMISDVQIQLGNGTAKRISEFDYLPEEFDYGKYMSYDPVVDYVTIR
ncbi:hypothetical protein BpHYR1_007455 [Brachionus plicatilis]|uniref:Uncharacterized protein n=1 Tax=Brachionus plicatilis TaxID=10195 RepID=A0A3M7Q5U8_BRAPC|nr:hypothetical protein BpHYR1_007455 [Brachionus plicatilis]